MEKVIVNNEELKINKELKIELISYEGDGSPYRILSNKNEFIILDNNNYGVFHGKSNENDSVTVTYMDPNLEITINKNVILVANSKEE
ncbi:hypothetical protein [Romboutsia lituseburensis]|uniref:hypothetical protein n=1 Tax=Romboutsia lituseburensis TaxID=1537 RepID=UPI0022EB7BB2|nr:hypothetical protein [Romboutsia lituseburensis]